jgi:hypothetical protein
VVLDLLLGDGGAPAAHRTRAEHPAVGARYDARDAVSAYGDARAQTPKLDALAEDGVRFANARATSAWTVPTHGSLFTGLYPSTHGAHHESQRLDASQLTLAGLLKPTHATAGFSENPHIIPENGFAQGFDVFDLTWRQPRRRRSRRPHPIIVHARRWLEKRDRSRPFFPFINLITPPLPYDPPGDVLDRFTSDPRSGICAVGAASTRRKPFAT